MDIYDKIMQKYVISVQTYVILCKTKSARWNCYVCYVTSTKHWNHYVNIMQNYIITTKKYVILYKTTPLHFAMPVMWLVEKH